jgi:hypothetical protein
MAKAFAFPSSKKKSRRELRVINHLHPLFSRQSDSHATAEGCPAAGLTEHHPIAPPWHEIAETPIHTYPQPIAMSVPNRHRLWAFGVDALVVAVVVRPAVIEQWAEEIIEFLTNYNSTALSVMQNTRDGNANEEFPNLAE